MVAASKVAWRFRAVQSAEPLIAPLEARAIPQASFDFKWLHHSVRGIPQLLIVDFRRRD
jgi:hypothetical protein